jgi:uncharacterized membrane protein
VHDALLALHVIAAVFLLGPIAAAGPATARAVRARDISGIRAAQRTLRIYGWASLLVLVLGLGLVRREWGVAFGDAWVWVSITLFVIATALVVGLALPAQQDALADLDTGADPARQLGKIMAGASLASLAYVAIAVLMVYQPGG